MTVEIWATAFKTHEARASTMHETKANIFIILEMRACVKLRRSWILIETDWAEWRCFIRSTWQVNTETALTASLSLVSLSAHGPHNKHYIEPRCCRQTTHTATLPATDRPVLTRSSAVTRVLDSRLREPGFESCPTLGQFIHSTLLQFAQLYEWVSGYRQWWTCVYE